MIFASAAGNCLCNNDVTETDGSEAEARSTRRQEKRSDECRNGSAASVAAPGCRNVRPESTPLRDAPGRALSSRSERSVAAARPTSPARPPNRHLHSRLSWVRRVVVATARHHGQNHFAAATLDVLKNRTARRGKRCEAFRMP